MAVCSAQSPPGPYKPYPYGAEHRGAGRAFALARDHCRPLRSNRPPPPHPQLLQATRRAARRVVWNQAGGLCRRQPRPPLPYSLSGMCPLLLWILPFFLATDNVRRPWMGSGVPTLTAGMRVAAVLSKYRRCRGVGKAPPPPPRRAPLNTRELTAYKAFFLAIIITNG